MGRQRQALAVSWLAVQPEGSRPGYAPGEVIFGIMSAPSVLLGGCMKMRSGWTAVLALLCSSMLAKGQQNTASPAEYSFTISASQVWTDTGVDLVAGDA